MTAALSPLAASRLEKAAMDNGFDHRADIGTLSPGWLSFVSTQCPLQVWLRMIGPTGIAVGLSRGNVARSLEDHGFASAPEVPIGAAAASWAPDLGALHRLLRLAFQLSRALPDELLHTFERRTAAMPRATEAERLVIQRVGQDLFRDALLGYWEGRCAATGLAVTALLRAGHIKPWADCADDSERLDVFNGLLLAPQLDAAFDRGFVTVHDDGEIGVASTLDRDARRLLGLDAGLRIDRLTDAHRAYLRWHRDRVFRSEAL